MLKLRAVLERHARVVPLVIAAVSLLAHAHFFLNAPGLNYRYDSRDYIPNAKNLAAGNGFRDAGGAIESRRTPAYPLFASAFYRLGMGERSIAVAQHLIAVGMVLILYFAMLAATGDIAAAALAALCLAIDSGQIYMANIVMTEVIHSVTLLLIVVLLLRFTREPRLGIVILSAILVGIAALERPSAMYLALPLTVWIALVARRRRAIAAVGFLAVSLALPLLWMWRNYRLIGEATLSTIGTEDLYYWRGAGVLAMERTGFEFAPLPFGGEENFRRTFFRIQQKDLVAREGREWAVRFRGASPTAAQVSRLRAEMGRQIIREHALALIPLTLNGALHLIFDSTWEYPNVLTGALFRGPFDVLLFLSAILCFVLAIVGFVKWRRVNPAAAWLLLVTIAYFVAVLSGPEHEQWRYRIPLAPLVSMLVGASVLRRADSPVRPGAG